MRFGLSFPQKDIGNDPAIIRDFAQAAEELGFERLTIIDHVLAAPDAAEDDPSWAEGYTLANGFHEPMTLLGFMAAVTGSIRLMTANIILPQRQTVLVAKQAAEVDILSRGRLDLGVGLGWNRVEYQALGMNFEDRGKRIEEQVHLMRGLWTEPAVTFDGEWHNLVETGLNPKPVQRPIPVWFGAVVDPAVRRAARLGDGLLVFPHLDSRDEVGRTIELFLENAAAAGRDPATLGVDGTVFARDGGVDDWMKAAESWKSLGATTVTFRTSDSGYRNIDAHIDAMRRLAAN